MSSKGMKVSEDESPLELLACRSEDTLDKGRIKKCVRRKKWGEQQNDYRTYLLKSLLLVLR